MVNKKAYMKTLEALIAIVLFLIFITAALVLNKGPESESIPQDIKLLQDSILDRLQTDVSLRKCLIANDTVCINDVINSSTHSTIKYDFDICNKQKISDCVIKTFPPNITIYADSLIIKENQTAIIRLFFWKTV